MQTKNSRTTRVDHDGIQKNVIRLVLSIFFLVAVSATAGFLQGERVATNTHDSVAGVCVGTLSDCPDPDVGTAANPKRLIPRDFTGGAGSEVVIQGENKNAASKIPAPQAKPETLQTCLDGQGENCRNKCSTTYVTVANGTPSVTDCYGKGEDQGRKAVVELAKCVAQNDKSVTGPDDIIRVFERLLPEFESGMCTAEWKSEAKSGTDPAVNNPSTNGEYFIIASKLPLITYPIKTPPVPVACEAQYSKVLAIIGATNTGGVVSPTAANAQASDVSTCAWKGAVHCYPTDPSKPNELTCKKKIESKVEKDGRDSGTPAPAPAPQCTGNFLQKMLCNAKKNANSIGAGLLKSLGKALGGQGGQQGGGSSGGSGSKGAQQPQACPSGYDQSSESGRTICTKQKDPNAVKPQCLILASDESIAAGETVTLRWRTANAQTVHVEGVGNNVDKNGQKDVKPTQTTTYRLNAAGEDSSNATTCDVTVVVDGKAPEKPDDPDDSDDEPELPSTANPPRLSCAPSIVRKGKSADITWACPASADASASVGFDTGKKLTGDITVTPEHNIEYSVTCSMAGKNIGTNSCVVTVGEPQYDIVAHPKAAKRGDRVRISWGSLFMKNCRVQGPRGFDYTREQGVVITEPFSLEDEQVPNRNIRSAIYGIECESQFGGVVSRDVVVELVE